MQTPGQPLFLKQKQKDKSNYKSCLSYPVYVA